MDRLDNDGRPELGKRLAVSRIHTILHGPKGQNQDGSRLESLEIVRDAVL